MTRIHMVVLSLTVFVGVALTSFAKEPWPRDVKEHVAVKPGEHPRLLFRRSELPALRARAKTPEGRAILRRLGVLLNGRDGTSMPNAYNPVVGKASRDGSGPTDKAPPGMYTFSLNMGLMCMTLLLLRFFSGMWWSTMSILASGRAF